MYEPPYTVYKSDASWRKEFWYIQDAARFVSAHDEFRYIVKDLNHIVIPEQDLKAVLGK